MVAARHLPEPDRVVRARQPGAGHGNPQVGERCRRRPASSASRCRRVGRQRDHRRLGQAQRAHRAPPSGASSSGGCWSRTRCARSSTRCARRSPTSCASSPSGAGARRSRDRYDETVRLSRARFRAGDISEAELRKIELEGLRYQNDVIDAETELDLARQQAGGAAGPAGGAQLPARGRRCRPTRRAARLRLPRADAAGAGAAPRHAGGGRGARVRPRRSSRSAKREALPDITLGGAYTHSDFTCRATTRTRWR